jgi:peptidoglycan hydrolase-like protein with peptidoglycan-binding domain
MPSKIPRWRRTKIEGENVRLSGRTLALAIWTLFGSVAFAQERVGPSFDCAAARQPLAQMLCASSDLARTDLLFSQAYWALFQQVGEAGKKDLKQEDIRFIDAVQQQCGVPHSGPIPPEGAPAWTCVRAAYEKQRVLWLSRLTPPASEEANRPIERHIALQRALQKLGFLPAGQAADGVYGPATRAALSQWQRMHFRPETGLLGDADATVLEEIAAKDSGPRTVQAAHTMANARSSADENLQSPSSTTEAAPSVTGRAPPREAAEPDRTYSDPATYCRVVNTIDRPDSRYNGPDTPRIVVRSFGLVPEDDLFSEFAWRCLNGRVLACQSPGDADACIQWPGGMSAVRVPTSEMNAFCKQNPGSSFIPYSLIGHSNPFEWHCSNDHAEITKQLGTLDERGFHEGVWQPLDTMTQTPIDALFEAIGKNDLSGVKSTLEQGMNVNATAESGSTPLYIATAVRSNSK